MTNWRVEVSFEALLDLRGIERHLEESHREFGESPEKAMERAQRRSDAILDRATRLHATPYIGQRVPQFVSHAGRELGGHLHLIGSL